MVKEQFIKQPQPISTSKPTSVLKDEVTVDMPKKQTADYDGTSYCRNKGSYADYSKCMARKLDCRFYEMIKKKDGTIVGVCQKRYNAKKLKKRQQETADIKHIQDISTYNRRRN